MSSKAKITEAFRDAMNSLQNNPGQKKAVETTEGPVLVVAGPGTGKTQVLSLRIGHILLNSDTQAHNILCLTFTDAGTVSMRSRLLKHIGVEAYNVRIHTFHSFCNEVIQSDPYRFNEIREARPADDLELIDVFQELIDRLPVENPVRATKGDMYQNIPHLQRLFSLMRKENWSPDDIIEMVDEAYAADEAAGMFVYSRNGRNYKKGDPKLKDIRKRKDGDEKLKAAAAPVQKL